MKLLRSKFFVIPAGVILAAIWTYFVVLAFQGKIEIPKAIVIGDFQFRIYGIVLAASVLISASVFEKLAGSYAKRDKNFSKSLQRFDIYEALIWAIIPGIIFARVVYFLSNLSVESNLSDIYKIWEGGVSIFGGVMGGVFGIIIYLKKSKLKTFPILDLMFITVPLGHAIGRWANFINQEIYGPPTNLPWKMYISPTSRVGLSGEYAGADYFHPLFLYEFILNLLLFGILYFFFKKGRKRVSGFFISVYCIGYGLIRFFIEFLRFDPKVLWGFSAAQFISLAMMIGGTGYLIYKRQLFYKSLAGYKR